VSHECQRYRRGSVIGNRRGLDWRRNGARCTTGIVTSWPENVGYRSRIHHNPSNAVKVPPWGIDSMHDTRHHDLFCRSTTPLTAVLIFICYNGRMQGLLPSQYLRPQTASPSLLLRSPGQPNSSSSCSSCSS
jgi:hypothetical protein